MAPNLLTDADSITDIFVSAGVKTWADSNFCFCFLPPSSSSPPLPKPKGLLSKKTKKWMIQITTNNSFFYDPKLRSKTVVVDWPIRCWSKFMDICRPFGRYIYIILDPSKLTAPHRTNGLCPNDHMWAVQLDKDPKLRFTTLIFDGHTNLRFKTWFWTFKLCDLDEGAHMISIW